MNLTNGLNLFRTWHAPLPTPNTTLHTPHPKPGTS